MHIFQLILFVMAFVLFLLVTFNTPSTRVNLLGAGLACLTLAWLLGRVV